MGNRAKQNRNMAPSQTGINRWADSPGIHEVSLPCGPGDASEDGQAG